MPKGGKGARARRRKRRGSNRRGTSKIHPNMSLYGPVVHMPIRYFGTFTLTEKLGRFYGQLVAIGNQQLFASDYTGLKLFHEYRLNKAVIKVTWNTFKLKTWKFDTHPDSVAVTAVSVVRDMESKITNVSSIGSFDTIASTLGAKVCHVPSGQTKSVVHVWYPTEPSEKDWRLLDNDGLCNLYLWWRSEDLVNTDHACCAVVEIFTNISLRSINMGKFDVSRPTTLLDQHAAAMPQSLTGSDRINASLGKEEYEPDNQCRQQNESVDGSSMSSLPSQFDHLEIDVPMIEKSDDIC